MALWTWWPGDARPTLDPSDDFTAQHATDLSELGSLTGLARGEIEARLGAGNRCYVARVGAAAAAYGWVATAEAAIGELDVAFRLAGADRYLWDFRTLPEWRGRGLYPRLLQSILRHAGRDQARFWIINAPENRASARGIDKAGFWVVGDLAFARAGRAGLVPAADLDRAQAGAALLGVPMIQVAAGGGVSPCWCCVMDALRQERPAACWPAGALEATTGSPPAALEATPCSWGRRRRHLARRKLISPTAATHTSSSTSSTAASQPSQGGCGSTTSCRR